MPDRPATPTLDEPQAWSDGLARDIETIDEGPTPQRLRTALGDLVPIGFCRH